jgi:hypothetical protein
VVLLHRSVRITSLCRYISAWDSRCIMDQLVPCAPAPALRNKDSTVEQALWNITITKSPPPDRTLGQFSAVFVFKDADPLTGPEQEAAQPAN